jgi:hypothetical protein
MKVSFWVAGVLVTAVAVAAVGDDVSLHNQVRVLEDQVVAMRSENQALDRDVRTVQAQLAAADRARAAAQIARQKEVDDAGRALIQLTHPAQIKGGL